MDSMIIDYLGPNSYAGIVSQIANKIQNEKANTIAGNNVLSNMLTTLNESKTPMMDLREFTTNAEKLAPNDAKFTDVINFIKGTVNGGDLNFLVNLAKEEHFKEMHRAGFPSVEDTIKDFESLFNETPSIIEQGIKNGLLDKLQSNLLMDIKSELIPDGKNKILKEPAKVTMVINENNQTLVNDSLIMYSPVAISMEDIKNNRMLLLTESDVLSINRETKEFNRIPGNELAELNIPDSHKRMMSAIQQLTYNPIEEHFSLNEKWDFDLKLTKNGELNILNENSEVISTINKGDIIPFLMESIDIYTTKFPNFNKQAYIRDADNMILLTENHNKLIKIDNLKTIRNLNENTYVVLEPNSKGTPKIISGTGLNETQLFESYIVLNENCNKILNHKLVGLFESQLEIEKQFTSDKFNNIQKLNEEQDGLNQAIIETDNLLKIAEENSPAFDKLNETRKNLSDKLDNNLTNLNAYINNHKLY